MRGESVIVGVGTNSFINGQAQDELATVAAAVSEALRDARLGKNDLDGLMVNMAAPEAAMDVLAARLGLERIRFAFQSWPHGRMNATVVAQAALAVLSNMAEVVACVSTFNTAAFRRRFLGAEASVDPESLREGRGPHLEAPFAGLITPPGGAALAARKYLERYGYEDWEFGHVAVSQRAWAQLNANAAMRKPLSIEEYKTTECIVDPLRVHDMAMLTDSAVCVIVAKAERVAKSDDRTAVPILGFQGSRSARDVFVFGRTNLGVGEQPESTYEAPDSQSVYEMAALGPKDVDILGIFDTVSPTVPFGLEEFGFCGEGDGLRWIREGHGSIGGRLPVNTHGGSLCEGLTGGWGAVVELVRQLRLTCGPRQQPDVRIGQYLMSDRSSLILGSPR